MKNKKFKESGRKLKLSHKKLKKKMLETKRLADKHLTPKSNVDKHLTPKPNVNKNQCALCGNRYGNQYTLNYHMQLAHSLSCMYCDFKTTDCDTLEVHVSQHMSPTDVKADREIMFDETPRARVSLGKKSWGRKRLSRQFDIDLKAQVKKESSTEGSGSNGISDHERRTKEREFWKSQDIKLESAEKQKKRRVISASGSAESMETGKQNNDTSETVSTTGTPTAGRKLGNGDGVMTRSRSLNEKPKMEQEKYEENEEGGSPRSEEY